MSDPEHVEKVKRTIPTNDCCGDGSSGCCTSMSQFGTPFVVIRALSDIAGKESSISFDEFLPVAARHSTDIVLKVISKL